MTRQLRLSPKISERIAEFVDRCGQLGSRLGCILFQLPPDFLRDDAQLTNLLEYLPQGPCYAIAFRHESWLTDEVLDRLRERIWRVSQAMPKTNRRGAS